MIAFTATGSLREEVAPEDFCVVGQIIDWTKGVRPWTFFEDGVVGHVSMADPVDAGLSELVATALGKEGVLIGESTPSSTTTTSATAPKLHRKTTLICIEGPQFSTRAESHLYRSFQTTPPVGVINMSACPEAKLFREAEMAYSLVAMSTDYDSWHETNEGVSVEMVIRHMVANGANAKRGVEAILLALTAEGDGEMAKGEEKVVGKRLEGSVRGAIVGFQRLAEAAEGDAGKKAVERLRWMFGDEWVASGR